MKLTWLGATAFRVYVGGAIVVIDPDAAAPDVDRGELRAGADRIVGLSDPALPSLDPAGWRPRPSPRATEDDLHDVEIARIAEAAVLIAAAGEPALVVLGPGSLPRFGRWADGAVIVLTTARESLVA
ncbi:MAG: hypothetical protein ABI697_01500, partial [Devosia sp.]